MVVHSVWSLPATQDRRNCGCCRVSWEMCGRSVETSRVEEGVGNDMGGGKGACRFADRVRTDSRCNALVLQMFIAARHPPEEKCIARHKGHFSPPLDTHCDVGSNCQLRSFLCALAALTACSTPASRQYDVNLLPAGTTRALCWQVETGLNNVFPLQWSRINSDF